MSEIIKVQDKRRIFVDTLNELAESNPNIIVIIPDVGFNYLDDPLNKFKVLNTGVTEAFATIFAANLALEGWKVFYYTMINFCLFRNEEMVRNAIVCHKAPVTLVGVKGSSDFSFLGFSHNLLHDKEDFNLCDNIGLRWYYPQNLDEVKQMIKEIFVNNNPAYIRL